MKIAAGFLVGTIAGATLGLLFAPTSGANTRAKISDKARSLADSMEKSYEQAKHKYAEAKEKLGIKNHQESVTA